jgi:hypothetical protein
MLCVMRKKFVERRKGSAVYRARLVTASLA